MPGDEGEPTADLRSMTRAALDGAWVEAGYTAPNTEVYPWLWLWDSCFHSLIWAALGEPDRGVQELTTALSTVDAAGFVPHMGYQLDPERSVELWGRRGSSSITQPPMYGHAIATLTTQGVDVPGDLIDRAARGLRFLVDHRRREPVSGLIRVVHPWETGCDDSPRWDDLDPGPGFQLERWRARKMELLTTVEFGPVGEPIDNPAFSVAPAGFNALVAFNARELAGVTGDDRLAAASDELALALDAGFDPELQTWTDRGDTIAGSGRARTADALLPLLVCDQAGLRHQVVEELLDEDAYASAYGPRGVHAREPTYDQATYWRGPVWPQLAYLLWVALRGSDAPEEIDAAEVIRTTARDGAAESGLAEYWNGETGKGLGAIPQSWTGLAVLLDDGA